MIAEPYLTRPVGRPSLQSRTWTVELTYQAESWSKVRRIVIVVVEELGSYFCAISGLSLAGLNLQKNGETLISYYRERGATRQPCSLHSCRGGKSSRSWDEHQAAAGKVVTRSGSPYASSTTHHSYPVDRSEREVDIDLGQIEVPRL